MLSARARLELGRLELDAGDREAASATLGLPERYIDLGLLGRGGMGEVRRVRDRRLGAVMAMKLLSGADNAELRRRFKAEAQLTAQLAISAKAAAYKNTPAAPGKKPKPALPSDLSAPTADDSDASDP